MQGARTPTDELRLLLIQFRARPRHSRLRLVAKYQDDLRGDFELPLPVPKAKPLTLKSPIVAPRDPPLWLAMGRPRPPRPSIQPELKPKPKPKPAPIPPPKPAPAPPAPPPKPRVPRPSKKPPRAQEATTPLLREAVPVTEVVELSKPLKRARRPKHESSYGPVVKSGKFCRWCLDISDRRPPEGVCPGCKLPYQKEEIHAVAGHTGFSAEDFAPGRF
jgi:hypothetical protein